MGHLTTSCVRDYIAPVSTSCATNFVMAFVLRTYKVNNVKAYIHVATIPFGACSVVCTYHVVDIMCILYIMVIMSCMAFNHYLHTSAPFDLPLVNSP